MQVVRASKKQRWIRPYHWAPVSTSQIATVGKVNVSEFEITATSIIDRIVWLNGSVVAGNVRAGIYGPLVTEETCLGAPVISDTEVAQSGTNQPQNLDITPVTLAPGRYYVALEFSDATATYLRGINTTQVSGHLQFYNRSGGYGALTNPCPVVTNGGDGLGISLRCKV